MSYSNTRLFINGQWCDADTGKSLPVINPATGLEIGRVSCIDRAGLDRAVLAAQSGFEIWRNTPAVERSKMMELAAKNLRARVDQIAVLMTQEQGKPFAEAKAELMMAAEVIDWFAGEARRVYGRIVPARNHSTQQQVLKFPVGPVAAFTPWNFPVNQIVRKLSAALSAGCSMIVKAPEETPASPAALIQAFIDAGIPAGVIGLIYGNPAEISEYLIKHPIIKKITFTGSTPVGKQLAALAGLHMKRATMELGGHAPVIIAEDADVQLAAKAAGSAKFRNAGQVCISPTRFLVHENVKDEFLEAILRQVDALKVGNGLDKDITMGPLANDRRLAAMADFTQDAISKGAKLITGGERIGTAGNFFKPTIFADVPLNAKVFNDEPFGPMLGISTFKNLDEALEEANRLPFGLAGYAFTQSLKNSHKISQELQVGMLWINQQALAWPEMPFGGIKESGYGSEGGYEAVEAYINTKSVSIFNG
ncbi:NAD-dependent succinate-semialdehyde dehydrogenase [Polynucleobacter sp. AP-Elch-400A-B2]|uniref:NAD-dependent succinate-semialdehyde dehydrogenase n=1 Tax=Polynucleobacter sp. AP-Elch-400A-B2 TaxID=2576930 RepID=UPI001BFEA108|nr:NAD-dependent succinate-semialdehyde dehydrogenase [Polynucleobacter sp. AP-Elch-400A-B2]QWE25184.1 NAD-dependent succinate-semialdehyde dehydrogenase [Polynucleobacter sp. AP-Elch-400A-B2]